MGRKIVRKYPKAPLAEEGKYLSDIVAGDVRLYACHWVREES